MSTADEVDAILETAKAESDQVHVDNLLHWLRLYEPGLHKRLLQFHAKAVLHPAFTVAEFRGILVPLVTSHAALLRYEDAADSNHENLAENSWSLGKFVGAL